MQRGREHRVARGDRGQQGRALIRAAQRADRQDTEGQRSQRGDRGGDAAEFGQNQGDFGDAEAVTAEFGGQRQGEQAGIGERAPGLGGGALLAEHARGERGDLGLRLVELEVHSGSSPGRTGTILKPVLVLSGRRPDGNPHGKHGRGGRSGGA
ncbi:hypothetical protein SD37_13410 [Amycolatopsis orientalis]|uniref:Uncharacterized protein n=1 Tax=Amycolatopsis orientalis TaxID=31958 RepID=A0A193BWL0_AMYOR|nr:hypothetical protein SD37_13410 [Amycolatopsis orientalis]